MSWAVPGDGRSEYDGGAERWDGGECLSHCYTAVKRNHHHHHHHRSNTGGGGKHLTRGLLNASET